jgi:hypothetical protein
MPTGLLFTATRHEDMQRFVALLGVSVLVSLARDVLGAAGLIPSKNRQAAPA